MHTPQCRIEHLAGMLGSGNAPIVRSIRVLTDAEADAIEDSWDGQMRERFGPAIPNPGALTESWKAEKKAVSDWIPLFRGYADRIKKAAYGRPEFLNGFFGYTETREDLHDVFEDGFDHLVAMWDRMLPDVEYRLWKFQKWQGYLANERDIMLNHAKATENPQMASIAKSSYEYSIREMKTEAKAMYDYLHEFQKVFAEIEKLRPIMANFPIPTTFNDYLNAFMDKVWDIVKGLIGALTPDVPPHVKTGIGILAALAVGVGVYLVSSKRGP